MRLHIIQLRNLIFGLLVIVFITAGQVMAQNDSTETRVRPLQITFIYPVGSNGLDSKSIPNNVSLNILSGITGGVEGIELAGLTNYSTGNISGLQAAGLANGSNGRIHGVQMAGMLNYNRGEVVGLQAAGLSNIALNKFDGLQLGGLTNLTTKGYKGAQLSGVANVNIGEFQGLQGSGIVNTNVGFVKGAQISGILNVATKGINGTQIGLVNYSRSLTGFQLGLINIADSVSKGAGLGLITFYRNGYHRFEVEANETFYANLAFKSGVDKLYMIYSISFMTKDNKTFWAPGLGVGSKFDLSEKMGVNVDLISKQVNEDTWWTNELNMLNTLKLNFSYRFADRSSVYGGPSFNIATSGIRDSEGELIGDGFSPSWSFYEKTGSEAITRMYIGFNLGLRF